MVWTQWLDLGPLLSAPTQPRPSRHTLQKQPSHHFLSDGDAAHKHRDREDEETVHHPQLQLGHPGYCEFRRFGRYLGREMDDIMHRGL